MKRAPELADLSRDHHHALVLARRCAHAAAADPKEGLLEQTWTATRSTFSSELEPHFAVEEQVLLPALAAEGKTALVERTRREHLQLRELVALDAERKVLAQFAELLNGHVRFEEQQLFPAAEELLSASTLAAVEAASAALETARRRATRRSR